MSPSQDPDLELQYKVCYARILDSKRRFLEAALRYYDLSLTSSRQGRVDPEELIQSLTFAVTCTVLAPAGACGVVEVCWVGMTSNMLPGARTEAYGDCGRVRVCPRQPWFTPASRLCRRPTIPDIVHTIQG